MTLRSLIATPLPCKYILRVGEQVLDAIHLVHSAGYSVNDIKPSNLFLDSDGAVLVGDFGAFTKLGAGNLVEYSAEYLPAELVDAPVTKTNDFCCLASTLLEMLDQKPTPLTISSLVAAALLVSDKDLRDFIHQLLV